MWLRHKHTVRKDLKPKFKYKFKDSLINESLGYSFYAKLG